MRLASSGTAALPGRPPGHHSRLARRTSRLPYPHLLAQDGAAAPQGHAGAVPRPPPPGVRVGSRRLAGCTCGAGDRRARNTSCPRWRDALCDAIWFASGAAAAPLTAVCVCSAAPNRSQGYIDNGWCCENSAGVLTRLLPVVVIKFRRIYLVCC